MLKGSIVALVTPLNEDSSINYSKLKELLEYHIANATDGVVLLGTTGEATTISVEDQKKMIQFTVDVVQKKIPIIVGVGGNDTVASIEKAKEFSMAGVDYLLVITPYYNKTNEEGLWHHFKAIAEASNCPILLYNVPSRTGMTISPALVERLSKHPKIAGIKDATGDISYTAKISHLASNEFVILSGNDDIILPMMSLGASGVISVLANICPKQTHDLCALCLKNQFPLARSLQNKLLPIANALFLETNPIPVKAAMNYLGYQVGGYRAPLYEMSASMKEKLFSVLEENKEELF